MNWKGKKASLVGLLMAGVFVFTGAADCSGESNPAPDSDSSQSYDSGSKIPTDTAVYDIVGTVTAGVKSLTRQEQAAHGSSFGYVGGSGAGFSGFSSGSYFGPVQTGRGFVRITVDSATPATDLAPVGDTVILKVSDTKGTALLPGDTVKFRCRRQYEAVAAIKNNQKFDASADETWELDYCRLASPVITVGK
jgi:hypothetical protein